MLNKNSFTVHFTRRNTWSNLGQFHSELARNREFFSRFAYSRRSVPIIYIKEVIEFNPSWNFQRYFRKEMGLYYGNIRDIYGRVASAIGAPSETDKMIYIVNAMLRASSASVSPILCISLVKLLRNCQVQSALVTLITTLFRWCPLLIIPLR